MCSGQGRRLSTGTRKGETVKVISLGWGVQSFTLTAMSALGELEPVDFAIHADTTWERSATYAFAEIWTTWLKVHGVEVVTVLAKDTGYINRYGGVMLPAYTNGKGGRFPRECTSDWKIATTRRYLQSVRRNQPVEQWIGISKDEWWRAKDPDVQYITHRFPLLELDMTRADCIAWLERHGLDVPNKSSCTFCPFHKTEAWQEMKRENGPDWQQAVAVDAAIRDKRPPYPLYVHRSCRPLPEAVDIPEDHGYTQPSLLDICDSGACFL